MLKLVILCKYISMKKMFLGSFNAQCFGHVRSNDFVCFNIASFFHLRWLCHESMVDEYDFEFNPNLTNMYIPQELLDRENEMQLGKTAGDLDDDDVETPWRPFPQGGFLDVDTDELMGFTESEDWDLLDGDWDDDDEDFEFSEDDVWTY